MQRSVQVAYQGEAGAYSATAVSALMPGADQVPLPSLRDVFDAVARGAVPYGVVPIENSQAGSINETYDRILEHEVVVVAEVSVLISHCLMALPGVKRKEITEVASHPQALAQCAEAIEALGLRSITTQDTAGAARMVSERQERSLAAIASAQAARLHGLEILQSDLQDRHDNTTKFVAICESPTEVFGPPSRTSIVFATSDVPGALYRCLKEFADRQLNLSKLESRPSRSRAWHYHFYLDFDAPGDAPLAREALAALADHTTFLRELGSYPVFDSASG